MLKEALRPAKGWLHGHYRAMRRAFRNRCLPFGPPELLETVMSAGIRRGDAVFVHSSFTGFDGFSGNLSDVVQVFQEAVGLDGAVLMPTFSMRGTAVDYAASGRIFDARTTPSQTGMLTEVFRRTPAVARSIHPTHSVAVWGKDTPWWVASHQFADTPCGRGTPFSRLLESGAKIVLAGVGISVLAFYHCVEELLEQRMPESPFTKERYVLKYKAEGTVLETPPMRLYSPDLSRRRRLAPLERQMRETGRWRERRIGALKIAAFDATDVLQSVEELADRGNFCYTRR